MNNDVIQGIGYDKKPMPIYFYYGERKYLFGLIKRKRFGTNIDNNAPMPSGEITDMVKQFGDKAILLTLSNKYLDSHRFYTIVRVKKNGKREYFRYFSASSKGGKIKVYFTKSVMKAYVSASFEDVKESVKMIRESNPGDRITYEEIYLNTSNVIQQPNFVIYLYDINNGLYRYLSKFANEDDVRGCSTMDNALRMGYDEALQRYNRLNALYGKDKYHFTVINKPDDNVDAANVRSWQLKHHDTGRVQVGFHLNAYHHGEK